MSFRNLDHARLIWEFSREVFIVQSNEASKIAYFFHSSFISQSAWTELRVWRVLRRVSRTTPWSPVKSPRAWPSLQQPADVCRRLLKTIEIYRSPDECFMTSAGEWCRAPRHSNLRTRGSSGELHRLRSVNTVGEKSKLDTG